MNPSWAHQTSDKITSRMINMMKTYPLESAIKIRDTVMGKDFHTLLEEDQRRVERCLPARPENTLNKIKNRFMGSVTLMYQDSLNWQNQWWVQPSSSFLTAYSGVHDLVSGLLSSLISGFVSRSWDWSSNSRYRVKWRGKNKKYIDQWALKYLILPRRIRRRKKLALVTNFMFFQT